MKNKAEIYLWYQQNIDIVTKSTGTEENERKKGFPF